MSVILMYHRVADVAHDPFELAVHPDNFSAHVEHLSRLKRSVPLGDVRELAGTVAVTFDDGYADNATVAAPMLESADIPATWFVTTGMLGRRRFWWDRLAEALLGKPVIRDSVDVEVSGRAYWLNLRDGHDRLTAMRFLHSKLRPLPGEELETTVGRILAEIGAPAPDGDDLTMTTAQLHELAGRRMQEVGAHTRTHVQLAGQDEEVQRAEIIGSVTDLSAMLDRPVTSFAFPFGVPDAVGGLAHRLAEEAGCSHACTTRAGRVRRRSDPYSLPRLHVRDWSGEEFARQITRALSRR